MKKEKLGDYIKILRTTRGVGQRELARRLKISPSYLNDVEKNKRKAPSKKIIKKLAEELEGNLQHLYDLASKAQKKVPHDIEELLLGQEGAVRLLRTIKENRLSQQKIEDLIRLIKEEHMKAIIIAAGKGSRLRHYTEELPKCMLEFDGKTLLQRQLEALRENGIKDIAVVKGFAKDKINYPDLKYFVNDDYENNNILNSLFYAQEAMQGPVLVSYSDILYEKEVVQRLMRSNHDITIVVDIDWKGYYEGRKEHPISEAENVILDADNKVVEIGKIITSKHDVHGEFIGMMKFSSRGMEVFKRHFNRAKQLFWGKPFQKASIFQKAYLTDMIQDMLDMGVPIHTTIIERGWKEIDTVEDYEKATHEFALR